MNLYRLHYRLGNGNLNGIGNLRVINGRGGYDRLALGDTGNITFVIDNRDVIIARVPFDIRFSLRGSCFYLKLDGLINIDGFRTVDFYRF